MGILSAIILENEGFSLNDLSLIQRMALKKVFLGKLDIENISDKETDVLESLVSLGLLDMAYDLTPEGEHAAKLLAQYSKREREDLMTAKQLAAEIKPDAPSDDDFVDDDDFMFSENEKAAIRGAGLNEEDIKRIFKNLRESLSPVMDAKESMMKVAYECGFDVKWSERDNGMIEYVEVDYEKSTEGGTGLRFYLNDYDNLVSLYIAVANYMADPMADPDNNEDDYDDYYDEPEDQFRDDVEADADALASAGWGTDEDYGYYGDDEGW